MDMLYSRYSNPLDLMKIYINQGRFGEFVGGFLDAEAERKKENAEKELEMKLWIAYVHSESDKSYGEWRRSVYSDDKTRNTKTSGDQSLDDNGIKAIVADLFPTHDTKGRWWTLFFFRLTCSVALWGGRDTANK